MLGEELAEVRLRGDGELELDAALVLGVNLEDGAQGAVVGLAQHEAARTRRKQLLRITAITIQNKIMFSHFLLPHFKMIVL